MSVTDSTDSTARGTPRDGMRDVAHGVVSGPAREIGAASVDADNPWLGLASFTEESRQYFFGREGEVAELTRRVQRKLLTVLFGKSGLGKTSILRAGLVPRLRAQGYFPVYLRIDYGHDSPEPAEQIKQAINRAARSIGVVHDVGTAGGERSETGIAAPGESIWEFLHHRDEVLKDVSAETLTPLLIFDQFEELFTLAQSDEFGRTRAAKFIEELSDLVENRPPKALEAKLESDENIAERFDFSRSDYRVVIALREDYLAPLESLKKVMPTLSQNRLRLAPMTGSQALQAVLEPGNRLRPGKPLVSEEVAEAIVRFVAGGSELANAEVEPSLLSLICRELNEQRIAQGRSEISQDLLAGSHETILSNFYERSLADQPESVRRIIEDDLLTESGYRENLAEESLLRRLQAAGASRDALAKLVNHRLLRIEERLDVRRVELTHDVLTGVVKASRDQRHEREAREATERALAEQREREHAAHRALRRARAVAAGCTLLALAAIAAAVLAIFSVQRARRAELLAQQTRATSEQARQQAEGLLGFLTDDFVNELNTFGRYQTVVELSQREIDYFQHLPPQLKEPETIRSGALALMDHSAAAGLMGDLGRAAKNATEAIAILEPLERTDKSDATAVALGRAYTTQGLVYFGMADMRDSEVDLKRAADLLRPIAERAGASSEARVAYLYALSNLGGTEGSLNHLEESTRVELEALRVGRAFGAPSHGDVTVDADYAYAGGVLARVLQGLGRDSESVPVAEDALVGADRALMQRPQFGWALTGKMQAEEALHDDADDALDPSQALRFATLEEQTARALLGVEPNNALYLIILNGAYRDVSNETWAEGQFGESIKNLREGMEFAGQATRLGEGLGPLSLAGQMYTLVARQAEVGDAAGAAATVAMVEPYLAPSTLHKLGVSASEVGVVLNAMRESPVAILAYERDDFAAARRTERNALAQLQAHPPKGALGTELMNDYLADLAPIEGRAEYALGDLAAAEQSERTALLAAKAVAGPDIQDQRAVDHIATWLSMALAREGKRAEATQTIAPVVTMYRALEKKNHGDRWLPLELAEALYAQSLTDDRHRAALLREAAQRVDHLIPAIAALHDTRQWRARIEAAQRASGGRAAR
jgi:hypothetical protein